MGSNNKNIAYLGRTLPTISETFVIREIKSLRSLGCAVYPFSLFKPEENDIHPQDSDLAEETAVLYRPLKLMFWLAHLIYLFRHPVRYLKMFLRTFFNFEYSFKERLRLTGQFLIAPYAAWKMKRKRIDHIHAHFANSPTAVAMFAAELMSIGFSFTAHSFDIFIENQLLAQKISKASFVATVSEYNRTFLRENYPEAIDAEIHIIRCGIDQERFSPVDHPRSDPLKILSVGRLIDLKGFSILIKAIAILKKRKISVSCSIIGDGPDRSFLENLIHEQNVTDSITLEGKKFQDEILKYFSEADMFVLPCVERNGDADNLPVVLIEALAMRIPAISSPLRAIPEIIMDNKTGRLSAMDDPAALAETIEDLINNPGKAELLAQFGSKLVQTEFDSNRNARKLRDLFLNK